MSATKLTKAATVALGTTVLTRGASIELSLGTIMKCLERHRRCDWGELCQEDREANDRSLQNGEAGDDFVESSGAEEALPGELETTWDDPTWRDGV